MGARRGGVKLLYVNAGVLENDTVRKSERIGGAADISSRYGRGVPNHVHVIVTDHEGFWNCSPDGKTRLHKGRRSRTFPITPFSRMLKIGGASSPNEALDLPPRAALAAISSKV